MSKQDTDVTCIYCQITYETRAALHGHYAHCRERKLKLAIRGTRTHMSLIPL